jgi:dTDP-glucose 4,6-dehydratase
VSRSLLVTGGAGFIGSNFTRWWSEHHPEDRLVVLDALTYAGVEASLAGLGDRIVFVHGDIGDQDLVERTLREQDVTTVVNFAAESHNSYAIVNPGAFFATNVLGTQRLLEAVRRVGVERFHHVSTCEVYGDMALDDPGAFTEDSPYRPRTPYNASKAGGDHAVRAYGLTYDVPVTITNCSNNYGPYQFPEKVIPVFVTNGLRGLRLPVYRSSQNKREWLYVDDHARAIEAVLDRGRVGETYHVGSGVEVSVAGIASTVLAELGLDESRVEIVPDRPSHDRRYLLDSSKLRDELGWAPQVEWTDGIKATVAWYEASRAWWEPLLDRRPIDESAADWQQGQDQQTR